VEELDFEERDIAKTILVEAYPYHSSRSIVDTVPARRYYALHRAVEIFNHHDIS
jgi:hypothetical protein